jgi:4-diphosphocytidyl-2-C-methyl-D-erythritol kinase
MPTFHPETAQAELAPAKVNLTLRVRGRRSDGYHELQSLVAFADIGDTVAVETGPPTGSDRLTITGPFAGGITGENLLTRAVALLRAAHPHLAIGAVHLDKRLPVAAGLGGGSADAAALLRVVRSLNPTCVDAIPWMDIAAQLGSDVPVCFGNRPALIRGRGERISLVPSLPDMYAVLVNPLVPLATASVFAALKAGPTPVDAPDEPAPSLQGLAEVLGYMRGRGNDMEAAAVGLLSPIGEIKALLAVQPGCLHVAMSGSGPTCFAILSSEADTRRAASAIAAARPDWWVAAIRLRGARR